MTTHDSKTKYSSGGNHKFRLLPIYLMGLVWCVVLALGWSYEEPNKLATLTVLLCVFILGVGIIHWGKRVGIVHSRIDWIVAFIAKITVSFLITSLLWAAPLTRLGLLRSPDVFDGAQDSHLYDYQAVLAAEDGLANSFETLSFSWLSFGVVGYIAAIYSVFGVSVLYPSMFNALMSLTGFIGLTGVIITLDRDRPGWQWLRWGMLIPFLSYYDATPAKEPLTNAFYYLTLYFIVRIIMERGVLIRNVLGAMSGILVLSMVRPNVAFLLLLTNMVFLIRTTKIKGFVFIGVMITIVLGSLAFTSDIQAFLFKALFNPSKWFEVLDLNFSARQEVGDNILKLSVGDFLVPRNLINLLMYAPIRMIIWLLLPYPFIFPDFSVLSQLPTLLTTEPINFFRIGADLPALASTWLIIFFSPYMLASLPLSLLKWKKQVSYGYVILFINLLIPALVISNLMFIMGRRYRTLLEPLLLVFTIWGLCYGRPEKYIFPIYLSFFIGLVAYAVYSFGNLF